MTKVSLFMPVWNRREFTEVALGTLLENTTASLIEEFLVVDTGSHDGADGVVETLIREAPFRSRLTRIKNPHVVSAMQTARDTLRTEWVAKIDSDTVPPPGWLEECLGVIGRHPELWALGIEPFTDFRKEETRGYKDAVHVGGIGLFRRKAWEGLAAQKAPFFGWTEHQHKGKWKKGWLDPALPVILLDRLPFDPYRSLTEAYRKRKWQRFWGWYPVDQPHRWDWRFPDWRNGLHGSAQKGLA